MDLLLLSKIESSKSEIRRLLKGNAIRINNNIIADEKFLIKINLFEKNKSFKLSIGKKKHLKVLLS
jgi:tyrosyl-tRNA synthetase